MKSGSGQITEKQRYPHACTTAPEERHPTQALIRQQHVEQLWFRTHMFEYTPGMRA